MIDYQVKSEALQNKQNANDPNAEEDNSLVRTDFEIHAEMTAARSVGGDFFDFFLVDEHRLGIVIGDVSGKGVPAALYMAVTRTQIKTTALGGMTPEDCMRDVNRFLVREKASSMFATCFYGILNTQTGEFRYCNAGHNPPYLLKRDQAAPKLVSGEGGLPLGLFDGLPYEGARVQLSPGDAIFLFTDGVPEANNADLEDFTDSRLEDVLSRCAPLTCKEIVQALTLEIAAFTAGAPQSDDITMLSLRMSPASSLA